MPVGPSRLTEPVPELEDPLPDTPGPDKLVSPLPEFTLLPVLPGPPRLAELLLPLELTPGPLRLLSLELLFEVPGLLAPGPLRLLPLELLFEVPELLTPGPVRLVSELLAPGPLLVPLLPIPLTAALPSKNVPFTIALKPSAVCAKGS